MKEKILYALYDDDQIMISSIKKLINYGIKINEIYSPFPIHGINKIINYSKEDLSSLAFKYGLFGLIISSILTWYSMIFDWPQNIGGKPSFYWNMNLPSFIPVIFEITIFCSAHFMCLTYFTRCNLYPGSFPKNPDYRTTDDKFLIEIKLMNNHLKKCINLLKKNGVIEINIKKNKIFYV